MSGQGVAQVSFSSGELAPSLYGRVDIARYSTALRTCNNFIVRQYGGVTSRPGTRYIGRPGFRLGIPKRVRLIPFQFSVDQTYVLEVSEHYARVMCQGVYLYSHTFSALYTGSGWFNFNLPAGLALGDMIFKGIMVNGGYAGVVSQSGTGGGAFDSHLVASSVPSNLTVNSTVTLSIPLEITTPWAETELPSLSWTQSADILTVCHPSYAPHQIRRTGALTWDCIPFVNTGGPFQEINIDTTKTVCVSGSKGQITLSSSEVIYIEFPSAMHGMFYPSDIGNLFYVEQMPDDATPSWEVSADITAGSIRRAGVNYYQAMSSGKTGTVRPSHIEGSVSDGTGGVNNGTSTGVIWQWLHNGRGIVKIDSISTESENLTATSIVSVGYTVTVTTSIAHGMINGDLVYVTISNQSDIPLFNTYMPRIISVVSSTVFSFRDTIDLGNHTATGSCGVLYGSKIWATVQGPGQLPAALMGYQSPANIIGLTYTSGTPFSNSPWRYAFTTSSAHSFIVGDIVVVSGVTNPLQCNGKWTVMAVTATTVSVDSINGISGNDGYFLTSWTITSGIMSSASKMPTYKWAKSAWGGDQGYPACTTYFQQRQWFGGTPGNPQGIWSSVTSGYNDFSTSVPLIDSDAITRTCKTNKVNSIRQFAPLSQLLVLTTDGPFAVFGGTNGVLTPADMILKSQGSTGCAALNPVVIDNFCLYVQDKSSIVKAIGYNWQSDTFQGSDVSKYSNHLLLGHTVKEWAYQAVPFSVIWCVRDDGVLLSFTFMSEDQVMGWASHTTDGLYESVAVISEGQEDAVYVVVNRNGTRFTERFSTRQFSDVKDAFCVDCGLSYSGSPATVFSGLDHLNGRTVAIVADGVPKGTQVVSSGAVTLPVAASKVHVGLPYVCDMETLDMVTQAQNIRDKQKIINHVSVLVQESSVFNAGPDATHLTRYVPQLGVTTVNGLTSDLLDMRIACTWSKKGRVMIRQDQPLPLTVLAVIPEVAVAGS